MTKCNTFCHTKWKLFKQLQLTLLSITTITISFTTIACGWTVGKPDINIKIIENEWKEPKFNYPVMPNWQDLNIVGHNKEEWERLKQIYDLEVINGQKQLDAIEEAKKLYDDLKEFDDMVGALLLIMVDWYKQIVVEIDHNLWLINHNLTFEKLLRSNHRELLNKVKNDLNLISHDEEGLFIEWSKNYNLWNKLMTTKYKEQFSIQDRQNWNRVQKHLTAKYQKFKSMISLINDKLSKIKKD